MADLSEDTVDIRAPGVPPIDLVVEVKVALIETGLLTLADPDEADIDHSAEEIAKVFHDRIWSMQDKAESHERLSTQAWNEVRELKRMLRLVAEGGWLVSSARCSEQEIAWARAENRMFVDRGGIGYIVRPAASLPTSPHRVGLPTDGGQRT